MNGEGKLYIYIYTYIYMYIYIYIYTHTHTHTHVYIHTHNGILVIQKNEILKVATICIMLSEICQRKTNISYM